MSPWWGAGRPASAPRSRSPARAEARCSSTPIRPRNGPAWYAHGLLTRDGIPPEELRRLGRAEIIQYGAAVREGEVADAVYEDAGYTLTLGTGETLRVRVLVLAPGVVDELPEIEGLQEAWGLTVAHCPYCHGHELRDQPTAVLGRGMATYHQARFLRGWTGDITVVTNGPEELDGPHEDALEAEGIPINRTPIRRLRHTEGCLEAIEFEDGTEIPCGALYVHPGQRCASALPTRLGVAFTDTGRIAVDSDGRTGLPALFACGDAVNVSQHLAGAIAGGVAAGMTANHDLICGAPTTAV